MFESIFIPRGYRSFEELVFLIQISIIETLIIEGHSLLITCLFSFSNLVFKFSFFVYGLLIAVVNMLQLSLNILGTELQVEFHLWWVIL